MIKKAGIIINNQKGKAVKAGKSLMAELSGRGISVWSEDGKNPPPLDLMIILGGDGTVLQAFNRYYHLQVPFLCINFGSVGFLSCIEFDDFFERLPSIIAASYQIDERPVMKISVFRRNSRDNESYYALNDLVIRSNHLHVSRQLLRIDGRDICLYEGDGLIIATPTGSTGYALSAGASIVEPVLEAFVINSLMSRKKSLNSLIVGMRHELEIICHDSESRSQHFIDGRELAPLNYGESIQVTSTDFKARFVVLNPNRYFSLLHQQCI